VRIYPDLRGPRLDAMARDAATLLGLFLFAKIGIAAHDAVTNDSALVDSVAERQ